MDQHDLLEGEAVQELDCPPDSLLQCTFRLGGRLDAVAAPVSSEEPGLEFQLGRWDHFIYQGRLILTNIPAQA